MTVCANTTLIEHGSGSGKNDNNGLQEMERLAIEPQSPTPPSPQEQHRMQEANRKRFYTKVDFSN